MTMWLVGIAALAVATIFTAWGQQAVRLLIECRDVMA